MAQLTVGTDPAQPTSVKLGPDGLPLIQLSLPGEAFFQMPGMTKREVMAKAAMQGFLSNGEYYKDFISGKYTEENLVDASVSAADALINALNK